MRNYAAKIITLTPEQFEALIHKIKMQLKRGASADTLHVTELLYPSTLDTSRTDIL